MKELIRSVVRDVRSRLKKTINEDLVRRMKIINYCNIDTLFDIGANAGKYSLIMRSMGYQGRILSFEPVTDAFQRLKQASSRDDNWMVFKYGIGDINGKFPINVAGNSYSSSLLEMLPAHLDSAPKSKYVAKEEIEIKRLDSIFNSFCDNESRVMVKIDTQGFEKNVIDGASKSLSNVKIIQLEMSILPLYEKEMLFIEMINYLDTKGFKLFSLENGFSDPNTGRLLQIDGIFLQKNMLSGKDDQ